MSCTAISVVGTRPQINKSDSWGKKKTRTFYHSGGNTSASGTFHALGWKVLTYALNNGEHHEPSLKIKQVHALGLLV